MTEVQQIIARLGLKPLHPEGGYFKRVWTSTDELPERRATVTAIYYLMTPGDYSALHRLDADEIWTFCAGDPVEQLQLAPGDPGQRLQIGPDVLAGDAPQQVVPRGVWQGTRPVMNPKNHVFGWSLVSCIMSPGWSDEGFELGNPSALSREFPSWESMIRQLTRANPDAAHVSSAL